MFTSKGQQVIQQLNVKISRIDKDIMNYTAGIAQDMIPKWVRERVVEEGKDSGGMRYSSYRNAKHIRKRVKRGLNTRFKDFYFTGSMWNSFGVIKKTLWKNGFQIQLGMKGVNPDGDRTRSRGKLNKNIVNAHAEQESRSIVSMTNEEKRDFTRLIVNYVESYIKTGI